MTEIFDGDNKGPKDANFYSREADALKERAQSWRDIEINDKNAEQIAADIEKAASLRRDAENDRKELVRPFLDGQNRVNGEYKPVIERIDNLEKFMKNLLTTYMREVKRRQEEEARQKREQAERKKREAEALKDDPLIGRDVQREAKSAAIEADRAERARPNISGGGARAVGLKTRYKARITDVKALVMHYATYPDVIDAAERLANQDIRAAKGDITIPGVEVVKDEKL